MPYVLCAIHARRRWTLDTRSRHIRRHGSPTTRPARPDRRAAGRAPARARAEHQRARTHLPNAARRRQAARLVALDERQRYARRDHGRPRVDEARRDRWDADVRRLARHAAVRREPTGVDDAAVEGGVPSCRGGGRSTRPRDDDGGEWWLERDGWAVGEAQPGDEEGGMERDDPRGSTPVHWRA